MTGAEARLLLVDDEPQIVRALTPALQAAGYVVVVAERGEDALIQFASDPCDVIVLDLGLPDMDGKDVITRIREWSEAPIIVLSARDLEAEKIAALDAGADDFVNKPVGVGELLARIRASLRGRERRFRSDRSIGPVTLRSTLPCVGSASKAKRCTSRRGNMTFCVYWPETEAGWSPIASSSSLSGAPRLRSMRSSSECSSANFARSWRPSRLHRSWC